IRLMTSSIEVDAPSRIFHVSGLWQNLHRNAHPARNKVIRVPGPSTAVTNSQECTEPSSPARIAAKRWARAAASTVSGGVKTAGTVMALLLTYRRGKSD